ncbi:hypothetical protein [Nocardia stercoris]|uniref:Uncharacterized protein n=1 Tax=Nocardia stercoris TaxID=2483361 RepID=A0A3M2KYE8_9NOCA|nr:hypothetical protein [Nocardia stercoris]RMI29293.1 hypothetical protein EBN03_26510 [Nocardia stercoris]
MIEIDGLIFGTPEEFGLQPTAPAERAALIQALDEALHSHRRNDNDASAPIRESPRTSGQDGNPNE